MTEPTVSKDGLFWWDGEKWIAFDLPPGSRTYAHYGDRVGVGPRPVPPMTQNVNAGNPFVSGMYGCFGVAAAIIIACILLFVGCSAMLSGAGNGLNNVTTQQSP